MRTDLRIDMCIDMRIDICIDMCRDMCVDMRIDMCIDMRAAFCLKTGQVWRAVAAAQDTVDMSLQVCGHAGPLCPLPIAPHTSICMSIHMCTDMSKRILPASRFSLTREGS